MKKRIAAFAFCIVFTTVFSAVPAIAQAPPKTQRVEMRATTFGGIIYVLGFGACDMLNKHSDWVRGSVLESTGSPENIKIVGKDPAKRARTFFMMAAQEQLKAMAGEPPYDDTPEKYKDVKQIMAITRMGIQLVTADPNIKTLADLKGKRVATWPRATAKFADIESLIAGAGKDVLDSIKWQYTQYQGYDDLLLGKVDAIPGFFPMVGPGKYVAGLKLRELLTRSDKLRVINATPAQRKETKKIYGAVMGSTGMLPKDAIAPGFPAEDKLIYLSPGGWAAYPDLPTDVVYEMLSVWAKYQPEFKTYHPIGASINPKEWGLLPIPKEMWHPGAIKFFEENNVPYGQTYYEEIENKLMEKMQ